MHTDTELTKMLDPMAMDLLESLTLTEAARVCANEGFGERAMNIVFVTQEPKRNAKCLFETALVMRDPHQNKSV